jgi:hypothetical protein
MLQICCNMLRAICIHVSSLVRNIGRIFRKVLQFLFYNSVLLMINRLCGLVARVPGYRCRGPGFDSWWYHIFRKVVGLEQGLISLVWVQLRSCMEENREYSRRDPLHWPRDTLHPQKVGTNFADKRRLLGGIVHLQAKATKFNFLLMITETE